MREARALLPAAAPGWLSPVQRERIADTIERLLAILDADDGDPDREPSLGWSLTGATTRYDGYPQLADLEGAG